MPVLRVKCYGAIAGAQELMRAGKSISASVRRMAAILMPRRVSVWRLCLGANGADKAVVLQTKSTTPDGLAQAAADVALEHSAGAFLAAATSTGRDVAPRVAALLESHLFSDCTGLEANDAGFAVRS